MRRNVAWVRGDVRGSRDPGPGGGTLQGLASKVEHAQRPAIAGQQLGHRQAEPARSTGDEGAL
ncbi:MAG: hypothetical protein IPF50_13960 [Proteobacteria bacterium]|nr:hypothetical protein [Pseudomonadota bacterium]